MRVCIPGRRVFSSVVAVACLAVTAHGQTWTGSGGDGLWLTPNNWTPIAIPANDGTADLQFGTGSGRSTTVGVPWSVHSISFINSTGLTFSGFTITGQPITLGAGGLTNNRTNSGTQTISSAVVLDEAQAWTNHFGSFSTSSVVISGDVDLNAHHLTFAGSASTQVQGDISGDGGLTITGRTNLSGDNTYTGQTIVDGGTLTIGHANALGDVTGGLANGTILRNGCLLSLTGGLT